MKTTELFQYSNRIVVTAEVNIRASAAGSLIGIQPAGAKGAVTGGPIEELLDSNPVTWYLVQFDSSPPKPSGWVGADNLEADSGSGPGPGPGPQPPADATHFVSPSGSDQNPGTSAASPWKTLGKAISAAPQGAVVSIAAGTYSESPNFSGSATFVASGEVIVTGAVTVSGDGNVIKGLKSGFTLTSNPQIAAFDISGNNNWLEACVVDGNPQDGPAAGLGETLAFNFGGNSSGNTYFKCLAANLHDSDLWHIWGTNNTIDSCEAHSCDNPNYGTGAGAHADVIQCWAGTSKDCTVQNCYIHDIDSQIGITNSQGLPDGSGITWRNNIIAQVASVYFLYMPNARVYNNLFYRCSSTNSWPIWLAPGGQGEGTAGGNSDGVIIRNNAFVACGPGGSGPTEGAINCPTDGGHSTIDHNFLCDAANAGRSIVDWTFYQNTLGSDSVNGGDPAFVSENDFHTKAGSALRGKGVAISPAFPDRDGKARSGAWDIGPYQS